MAVRQMLLVVGMAAAAAAEVTACKPRIWHLPAEATELEEAEIAAVLSTEPDLKLNGMADLVYIPSYIKNEHMWYYDVKREDAVGEFIVTTGTSFRLRCPDTDECEGGCEFFAFHYHCPPCSTGMNGGWPRLIAEGWEHRGAFCAPRFVEAPINYWQPTSIYRMELAMGETMTTIVSNKFTKYMGWFAGPAALAEPWCELIDTTHRGPPECVNHCCAAR